MSYDIRMLGMLNYKSIVCGGYKTVVRHYTTNTKHILQYL